MTEQATHTKQNAKGAIASMVTGIVGTVMCWIPLVGLILGIIALVMYTEAAKDIKERGESEAPGKGMAIAGLVTGIVATVGGAIYLVYYLAVGATLMNIFKHI